MDFQIVKETMDKCIQYPGFIATVVVDNFSDAYQIYKMSFNYKEFQRTVAMGDSNDIKEMLCTVAGDEHIVGSVFKMCVSKESYGNGLNSNRIIIDKNVDPHLKTSWRARLKDYMWYDPLAQEYLDKFGLVKRGEWIEC